MASGKRDVEERQALVNMNQNAAEREVIAADPSPETSVPSLIFNLKSS